jgi:hypothetical protein
MMRDPEKTIGAIIDSVKVSMNGKMAMSGIIQKE